MLLKKKIQKTKELSPSLQKKKQTKKKQVVEIQKMIANERKPDISS